MPLDLCIAMGLKLFADEIMENFIAIEDGHNFFTSKLCSKI